MNCAKNITYCRSRQPKNFPVVEIFIPKPDESASQSDKMRYRLLKSSGNYAVTNYVSDFSIHGFKAALEELNLIPVKDPYADVKAKLQLSLEESWIGV